ncbi:hypothetical protein ColLi_09264 [Colletotrichum liriopes]|uniref:Uncharacterized protein n=1 Tax=Colletotrichum liriopes TaxID=708192 RepID=A0AA37LW67_9PEZI|nr:hypothetical protein ColLi_09264 [Colletotrichum liriopes]
MCAIGMMIWTLSDRWNDGEPIDWAIMVTTVLMDFWQMANLSIDAVYAIFWCQKGVFSEAAELGIYTRFDNIMGKRLGSKCESVLEGPTVKKTMRHLSRAEAADPLGLNRVEGVIGPETPELTVRQSLDRPKEMSKVRKAFNVARRVLAVTGYILSIDLAIPFTWQLTRDWGKMDLGTRFFETI